MIIHGDIDVEDFGLMRKSDLPNFEDTQDYLEGVVKSVYQTGDVEQLEHCLEELCFQFGVEFKSEELMLEKKI